MSTEASAIIIVPTLVVFVLAVLTPRPIESIIAGSLIGLMMIHGIGFVAGFAESSIRVLTDADVAWVILVCVLWEALLRFSYEADRHGLLLKDLVPSSKPRKRH